MAGEEPKTNCEPANTPRPDPPPVGEGNGGFPPFPFSPAKRAGMRGLRAGGIRFVLILLFARSALALGPHELLVLANRNSPRSLELARLYTALRQIPESNLIELDLPGAPPLEISAGEFTRTIWEPAQQVIRNRGLDDHILAWAYSLDFPIRISATPALSLQGITFLKGSLPLPDSVQRGTYASPLFAGPDTPTLAGFPPQSLDVQRAWLGNDMPLPSMMLGFMGPNGNTREEILACLRKGLASDRTRPDGLVCIVTNTDVRSLCRQWQFEPLARELRPANITLVITNAYPAQGQDGLIGLMAGAADIPVAASRFAFRPGAMADHLTSFAAAFDGNSQTKITEWIRAGATAAAGTVTEPLSIWSKFPHARIFAIPPSGCTLLESFFQAIRCPLQILIVGEPLSAPWAPNSTLVLRGLPAAVTNRQPVTAEVQARNGEVFNRFLFLLDGHTLRPMAKAPEFTLEPAALTPGRHKLRVVAYKVGSVRSQIFAETEFEVQR